MGRSQMRHESLSARTRRSLRSNRICIDIARGMADLASRSQWRSDGVGAPPSDRPFERRAQGRKLAHAVRVLGQLAQKTPRVIQRLECTFPKGQAPPKACKLQAVAEWRWCGGCLGRRARRKNGMPFGGGRALQVFERPVAATCSNGGRGKTGPTAVPDRDAWCGAAPKKSG